MHRRARRAALGAVMAWALGWVLGFMPLAAPAQELTDNLARAGFTPLHAAVWRNDVAAIQRLVQQGAPIDRASDAGTTPLHSAAMQPQPEALRALIALGAKLELRDRHGRTPLYVAAEVNPEPRAVIEALLVGGADRGAVDRFGKTPGQACWRPAACESLRHGKWWR